MAGEGWGHVDFINYVYLWATQSYELCELKAVVILVQKYDRLLRKEGKSDTVIIHIFVCV